jgi:hypothetical protein
MYTAAKPPVANGKLFAVAPMMDGNNKSKIQWFKKRRVRSVCSNTLFC